MLRSALMTKRTGVVGAVVIAVLAITGCGSGSQSNSGTSTGDLTDGGVLRFGLESPPTTLDPSHAIEGSAIIVDMQLGEALFETAKDGKAIPNLATKAQASPDGLTWTISLRRGVTFSNGQPMTSKDVVFSLEQAKASPYYGTLYEAISKVSAPSPTTVVLKLGSPDPALLAKLAFYTSFIVPDNYAGASEKEFAQSPIGTGPYAVSSAQRGQAIKLVPNSHYWKQQKPHLDELVFTPVTDENSRLQQIRGGDLDMTKATAVSTKTGVPPGSGIRVEGNTQNLVDFLLLNQHNQLFKDKRVRQAINLAVDREGIVQTATDGKGEPGASFLPPPVTYSINPKPPARDVAKAKQLIAEARAAGVDTDSTFTINSYSFDAYSGFATQIIQQNLEEIGLNVKLQPLDEAALNEMLEVGEYDAVLGIYFPALSDASELSGFYVGFYAGGAGQDEERLTEIVEEAAVEENKSKRAQLYAHLQKILIDEEGMLVLNYQPVVYPVIDEVGGLEFDSVGDVLLRNAGFSK